MIKNILKNIFAYKEINEYNFILPESSNDIPEKEFSKQDKEIVSDSLENNLEYLKIKYNMLINSDIQTREFTIPLKDKKVSAFIIYIDGMINSTDLNDFILKPILLKNSINMNENSNKIIDNSTKKKKI